MSVRVCPTCDIADCATHRPTTTLDLADRIEELEEDNKELALYLLAVHGQAADVLDRAVVAEAKLAKAMEALRSYTKTSVGFLAKEVLAKLEGGE